MCIIESGNTVLFQGDSITDAGWDRNIPDHLGCGYAMMVAAWMSAQSPERKVRFINRGIGGNRAKDLQSRWQEDCIDLKPDVVSILIGVNDTWRRFDSNDYTPAEKFEASYRDILTRTREKLGARIIIMEPFLMDERDDYLQFREDLDLKIHVVRKLAREFGTAFVPLDGIFAGASVHRGPSFWSPDGVHLTDAGNALAAQAWLRAVGVAPTLPICYNP